MYGLDSQGSSYARRSAFIPEARTLVRNHIRQLADYVVSEGTEHTEDGRWANTYDELYYHFGANITDANGNGKLLREELQRRDEVNELIMTEDCIEINYHLAYCQNCGEGGISGTLDLLSLLGCNLYDVHFTCDDQDCTPISRLSADTERHPQVIFSWLCICPSQEGSCRAAPAPPWTWQRGTHSRQAEYLSLRRPLDHLTSQTALKE